MIPFKIKNLSKVQVGMLNEYIDLILNGYIVQVQSYDEKRWFVKMRHSHNRRVLIVTWRPDCYTIREGKTILKHVGFLIG